MDHGQEDARKLPLVLVSETIKAHLSDVAHVSCRSAGCRLSSVESTTRCKHPRPAKEKDMNRKKFRSQMIVHCEVTLRQESKDQIQRNVESVKKLVFFKFEACAFRRNLLLRMHSVFCFLFFFLNFMLPKPPSWLHCAVLWREMYSRADAAASKISL